MEKVALSLCKYPWSFLTITTEFRQPIKQIPDMENSK